MTAITPETITYMLACGVTHEQACVLAFSAATGTMGPGDRSRLHEAGIASIDAAGKPLTEGRAR